jgi:signal transduction histidine kinase/DNA-binding response OmpR family regulator
MSYRLSLLFAGLLCAIGAAVILPQASRFASDEAAAEAERAVTVRQAAERLAELFAPLRRVADLGRLVDPLQDTLALTRLLADTEAASSYLHRLAAYANNGRLLAATTPDHPPDRPELFRFAFNPGPPVSLGRFRRSSNDLEVLAIARDLNPVSRLIAVAEITLAPVPAPGPEPATWRLSLPGGQEMSLPIGFSPPSLATGPQHWLYTRIGSTAGWWLPGPRTYVADVPGTDVALRVHIARHRPGETHIGALLVGLAVLLCGVATGGVLLARLLRDLARLESARETELRVQKVLGAIAQDARTPLGSIHGFAALLTETDLHPEQAEWAGRIQGAAQSLSILMDSLIDVGDPPDGPIELNITAVRPDLVIREVIGLFENEVQDRGLELRTRIENSVLEYFELDEKKIRRALFHILHNATKYTGKGEIFVQARVDESANWTHQLVIDVEDTGPGVPPEDREIIFERFRRGGGRDISPDGLGLGLFVARRLARALGGDVLHQARDGGGSIFTIKVPTRQAQAVPTLLSLRGKTALLVGFDPVQRARLSATLHRLGLVTETAPDGFLGLGTAERMAATHGDLDVILLDETLGNMPAEVFLRRLHSLSMFEALPVILTLRRGRPPETDTSLFSANIYDDTPVPDLEQILVRVLNIDRDKAGERRGNLARILIVEDNHVNRLLLVEILKRAGYSTFIATDAYAALNMLERITVDLVVLDIALPGMDGIELATRLKASGRTRSIPLIAVTAYDDAATLERAREAGVLDILSKPLDSQKFLRVVGETLKRARMSLPVDEPPATTLDVEDEVLINSSYLEAMFLDAGPSRTRTALGDFIDQAARDIPRLAELLASGIAPTDTGFVDGLRRDAENLGAVQLEAEFDSVLAALRANDLSLAASHAEAAERLWPRTRVALLRALARCETRYERRGSAK